VTLSSSTTNAKSVANVLDQLLGVNKAGMASSAQDSLHDSTGDTGGFNSKAVLGNDALISVGLSRAFEYNDLRVTPYARLTH